MFETAIKNSIKDITGLKVTPMFGTGPTPFITYTVTPISAGVVKESQVEVKIIDKNLDNTLITERKLMRNFNMLDNKPSLVNSGIVFRPVLSGGGYLFNDSIQLWELSRIFTVKWREING